MPAAAAPRPPRHVLVSSASRKVPLLRAVIDAARRVDPAMRVLAGDRDPGALTKFVADGFLTLPPTHAAHAEELRALCRAHGIGIVIPTRDGELAFWATHAAAFAHDGIKIIVSDPEAVAISVDKLRFARHGQSAGLPVIPTWEQPQGAGRFVVKERQGAGSRSIGLDLDAEAARVHARALAEPVFQPHVRGTEVSVDAWLDQGHRVKGLVLRTRDLVVDGESVVTTTFRDQALEAVCRRALESLPLRGPVVLQLMLDAVRRPHLIELNARFGGASTAGIAAGLDVWYWSLREALGADLDRHPFRRAPEEVRQVRVATDLHIHGHDL
jgi:carbamoyl-phosphate synthase large subunit